MNDMRWASIDAFAEQNRDNILRDITRLVAVPSVEGTPEPGAPFGAGPRAALDKALEIAGELGLDTFNADGYIGWAETGRIADGQKFLGTITHTDVVPEGNGWDADPYTVRVRDGWLLGRGVADDKGPSILCLYALKYLKDSGIELKYPVRALLGTNEETNMHDVDYYAEHYPMPAFCFTPDAEFPVCNGEKGGFNGEIVSPRFENSIITAFEGGVAHNAVPDRAACTVQVAAGALVPCEGVTFEAGEGGATVIRGWGKSGHAAMPEGTVNAIGLIVDCLLKSGVCTPQEEAYLQVLHTLQQQGRTPSVCGVDISRDALICAHRRAPELALAVASIAHLPVADASCDLLLNVFAPHDADEFARVLRPQGVLLRVIPLERHLWGLKCAVYDRPYENEVPDPVLPGFALAARRELRGTVTLRSQAEIEALFCMTPYYYKTGARDQAKLRALDTLTTETEFALLIYNKA